MINRMYKSCATVRTDVSGYDRAVVTRHIVAPMFAIVILSASLIAQKNFSISFSDEFKGRRGAAVDVSKWTPEVGGTGWGNEELQYYRDHVDNARHDGKGNLVITADKLGPESELSCWYGKCEYTSARLITKKKFVFKYGRVEARIKLPEGPGVWPAFWMLGNDIDEVGWPNCGEIDIMEFIGREPSNIYGTVHGPGYSGANSIGGSTSTGQARAGADFHIYAVEWSENEIRWFFDGKMYHRFSRSSVPTGSKWVFDHPFFIILNFAVGGKWPGPPQAKTKFPQSMLIDYVRVTAR
jgi:beta-glucanase (GH16 family)